MSNVITLNRENERPTDLMTFKQLEEKHGYKYGYLYKWACLEGRIKVYPAGKLKLSESEVLEFENQRRFEKYGRNK